MATVPYISLQPTYPQVFTDIAQALVPQEKVWISIYHADRPSLHSKLVLEPVVESSRPSSSRRDGEGAEPAVEEEEWMKSQGGVGIAPAEEGLIDVSRVPGAQMDLIISTGRRGGVNFRVRPTYVRTPRQNVEGVLRGSISAFDISPTSNGLFVAGGSDGQLLVGSDFASSSSSNGSNANGAGAESRRVVCKGHVGDVRSAKFFPSGEVILSTSSDMTARIYSALDGSNPRTLKGHKRAVTSSAIIGRGREVLTGSADGTTRLWDVGADKQIMTFAAERFSSVNALALGDRPVELDPTLRPPDGDGGSAPVPAPAPAGYPSAREGKLFAAGLSSGLVELHDLSSRTRAALIPSPVFPAGAEWTQKPAGPIFAVDWAPESHLLATGTREGIVAVYDVRMLGASSAGAGGPRSLLGAFRRNGAAINDLRFASSTTLPSPLSSFSSSSSSSSLSLLIGTSDGLPYRAGLGPLLSGDADGSESSGGALGNRAPEVVEEYAGWDCDSVEAVRVDRAGRVVLAGAHGCVRRY